MIIIWGFRSKSRNEAMLQLACSNGHVAAHRIVSVRRWFTLFFIPLIPVSKKYFSVCAMCGAQLRLPKEAAEEMLAKAAGTAPAAAPVEPIHPPIPTTTGPASPPAGWYPDPGGSGGQRYWDGGQWTESVQQGPAAG